ncbi:serine/threonine-protein kinase [Actinomadura scrupuli]|uniref:serine/threonine-protein kinase n=1 Tax=Actinomadura scrupuli TaxID=559629 RepID=UPI003D9784A5
MSGRGQESEPVAAIPDGFRYLHEPMRVEGSIPFLGDRELVEQLKERIRYSAGGAFLVTGFRGVGKTTLVLRALDDLQRESTRGSVLLPVVISVARSTSTDRLLVAIIRRTFETLNDQGYLGLLPPQTQQALVLSYSRTSLQLKHTSADASERAATLDLGLADKAAKTMTAGLLAPKLGMSAKRTRSLASEAAYLNYSETDAEYDLIRIVQLLATAFEVKMAERRGWWRRKTTSAPRINVVVVIDEVDKLTAEDGGLEGIKKTLSEMKNVLTMPGVHFLVVAGPDLHDRVLSDVGRGNSLYESLFAWRLYVPCSWNAPASLTDNLLRWRNDIPAPFYRDFTGYLEFKGRGMPRRLLQEFNGFVRWRSGRPYLFLTEEEMQRVGFYAWLEKVLTSFYRRDAEDLFPIALDEDRWRLGCYYVLDWVLRSNGKPFTVADIDDAVQKSEIDSSLQVSRSLADHLLEHLDQHDVIEVVRSPGSDSTMIGDVAEAQLTSYRLGGTIRSKLTGFAQASESERADLDLLRPAPEVPLGDTRDVPIMTLADRYLLLDVIGEGGVGTVYRGHDTSFDRPVAVKVLRSTVASDERTRARFRREIEVSRGIDHPHIVKTLDIVDEPDGRLALVMELVEGPELAQILAEAGPMPPGEVVRIGARLADALGYLAGRGLARVDIKPGNVILNRDRGPVIIDLGIVKRSAEDDTRVTAENVVVGTPLYFSPEMIMGDRVDIRSDIYALGLLLYVCLLGRHPLADKPMTTIFHWISQGGADYRELRVSASLIAVLEKAMARKPEDRYQRPEDLRRALLDTPEASAPA